MLTAFDVQRLLALEPLYRQIAEMDFDGPGPLTDGQPDMTALLSASVAITRVGAVEALRLVQRDVRQRMSGVPLAIRHVAEQAAVAAAFADMLDDDLRIQLSVGWALHAAV
jgi:hypothetical protein